MEWGGLHRTAAYFALLPAAMMLRSFLRRILPTLRGISAPPLKFLLHPQHLRILSNMFEFKDAAPLFPARSRDSSRSRTFFIIHEAVLAMPERSFCYRSCVTYSSCFRLYILHGIIPTPELLFQILTVVPNFVCYLLDLLLISAPLKRTIFFYRFLAFKILILHVLFQILRVF